VARHARRVINMRDGKLTGDTRAGDQER
jgi:hypothetical protein